MTLTEAYARYLSALAAAAYSPKTRLEYSRHLAIFMKWLGDDADVRAITAITHDDIVAYQAFLASRQLAPETRAVRVRAVKRFFEWLVDQGVLFVSPAERIVEMKGGRAARLPRVLSTAEVTRMLEQPDTTKRTGIRNRALLELLYATGLRAAEVLSLDLTDVMLAEGIVRVRRGKGAKSRVVPFGREARRWLGTYLADVRPHHVKTGKRETAFFLGVSGDRLGPERLHQIVKEAAKGARVPGTVSTHSLRHAFATHMIREGADIVTVSKLLGHASVRTTSEVYTRLVPADLKKVHAATHPHEQPDEDDG